MTSKEETNDFVRMMLRKAQEKDVEAKPYKQETNNEEIEKLTEELKKELAKKKR